MLAKLLARAAFLSFLGAVLAAAPALAEEKPAAIRIGVATFLSGPASVFGEPGKKAAELLAEELNKRGGILGVPVALTFVDEGAGAEQLVTEYSRLVQGASVDVFFAAISSGNCNKLAPLAEDLKILNILWDCGTQKIFETAKYRYVYRTVSNATPEVIASLVYLLKTRPDIKTLAVVNQDYAWGRDSWAIFSATLKQVRPDIQVVAELFPKFGAADYSTEVSRLLALKPDVVFSTSWGGDLDTFMRQAGQRGLTKTSLFVLPVGESSLERLGKDMPEGVIIGARGDGYFLHPELRGEPKFKAFVEAYKAKTGAYPIYPVFHMAQAFAALEGAYAKAAAANGGKFPGKEQIVDAMKGLEFQGFGHKVTLRDDGQGIADQIVGVTSKQEGFAFPVLDNMTIFPAAKFMPPSGTTSEAWIATLNGDLLKTEAPSFKHKP